MGIKIQKDEINNLNNQLEQDLTFKNMHNIFNDTVINEIDDKKRILNNILQCYLRKAQQIKDCDINFKTNLDDKVDFNYLIPSIEDYKKVTYLTEQEMTDYIRKIIYDFAKYSKKMMIQSHFHKKN